MGRNKDSLIALAEKLTGETCGEVLTKKDALKKIACFYAGEEVKCNTVADALQCIASHCNGGGGGASGGGNVIFYGYRMMGMEVLTPTLITESTNGKLTLIVNKNIGEPTNLTNVEVIEVDGGSVTIKGNVESGTNYGDTLTLSRAEDLDAIFYGAASSGSGGTSGGGASGETITPYAEKVYTGRGYTTALIFDHTQITGECTYTDVDGGVSNINLSTRTTNLYLDSTDIVSFELEINGSKVTVNVNE